MRFGLKVDGPGIEGICARAYEKSQIAITLIEHDGRTATLSCDKVFKTYPDMAVLRNKLEKELIRQGARCEEILVSDELTNGKFVSRDEYIALLHTRLKEAEADLQIRRTNSANQPVNGTHSGMSSYDD